MIDSTMLVDHDTAWRCRGYMMVGACRLARSPRSYFGWCWVCMHRMGYGGIWMGGWHDWDALDGRLY